VTFFLGVDSGGTKAEFVLGDETRELARIRTGTIKRLKVDAATAEANLLDALQQLQSATGVSPRQVRRCCIGTAGETVPLVVDWLREAFARHVAGDLIVTGDVEIALDSVFFGGRGVLVLAGTGSNVAGRAATGAIVTAGGWGPALADQGSGHFIGLEGLRNGFLAIDQRRPSSLLDRIQTFWNLASLEDLVGFANRNPSPDFSRLAPLVVQAAEQGDAVAQEVLERSGADLASLAGLVIEHLRAIEAGSLTFVVPAVAIAGSVLEHVAPVREALINHLRRRYLHIRIHETPADPPAGALWTARRGIAPGQE
jgi:N-acetylglucosamine kinase-like BadF-type ATPase